MADETEVHIATEAPDVEQEPEPIKSDVVASNEPSQSPYEQDENRSGAPTSATIGKRAIVYDSSDGNEGGELEQDVPPRKKARRGPVPGRLVNQDIMENANEGSDGRESTHPNSGDGNDSIASPGVSSQDFDRAGWSAKHNDSYGHLIAQARSSRGGLEKTPQPAAVEHAVAGLRTSFAKPVSTSAGLRTLFDASPSQAPSKPGEIRFEMHKPLTNAEREQLITAVRDQGSLKVEPLDRRNLKWTVSPLKPEYLVGNTWLEVWEATVDKWCEAFVVDNQANIAEVGLAPSLLKVGFDRRLSDAKDVPRIFVQVSNDLLEPIQTSRLRNFGSQFKPDLHKIAKKKARKEAKIAARQARRLGTKAAREAKTQDLTSNTIDPVNTEEEPVTGEYAIDPPLPVDETTSAGVDQDSEVDTENKQNEAEMEDGEINSADSSDVDMEIDDKDDPTISQAELDQRHRYFPGIPDDAIFCLTCGHTGHHTEKCPELVCKFCQGAHFKYECLTRQRCDKCKQIGHTKVYCPEKLAVAPGEAAIECTICEGHDHTEIDCIELYQIYRPQPGNIKKVKYIPAFCYVCGIEGHYGGDCRMADASLPPTTMWTMATASLYIDPNSDEVALSLRSPLPAPIDDSRPNIPGRSIKPQTHEYYVESDDDDDDDGNGEGSFPLANGSNGAKRKGNFLENKHRPKTAPKIKISSNIAFGGKPVPSISNPQIQAQRSQHQLPKRPKGPAQPPKKNDKPTNNVLRGTKPHRPRHVNQGGGGSGDRGPVRGDGNGGAGGGGGGGGFSSLNTNKAPRGGRRPRRGGGGGGGQK